MRGNAVRRPVPRLPPRVPSAVGGGPVRLVFQCWDAPDGRRGTREGGAPRAGRPARATVGPVARRSRGSAALERRIAELQAALDAERRRADALAQELASAQDEFSRTLSRINDLFWTVEILPDGEITLTYLSADASGVVGKRRATRGSTRSPSARAWAIPTTPRRTPPSPPRCWPGEPAEVEERLVGYDGVVRWTWSRGTPRREGDRLFFDGVTTNITERHELAEQREAVLDREREQVAMLEEMHRSRDDFIALAGHELRTPLTVIQGYAEHLLDDPTMGPEQIAQLEIVVRRARSMSDLIDDLFDLAKLDAPLTPIAFASVRARPGRRGGGARPRAARASARHHLRDRHRAGARGRRPRPAAAHVRQRPRQRREVQPSAGEVDCQRPARRGHRRPGGRRPGHRHPGRRAGPRLRAALPRHQRHRRPLPGHRPGALHRAGDRRGPRGHRDGGQRGPTAAPCSRSGCPLQRPTARRLAEPWDSLHATADRVAGMLRHVAGSEARVYGSVLLGPAGQTAAPAAGPHPGAADRPARRHQPDRRRAGLRALHLGHPEPGRRARHRRSRWPSASPSTWASPSFVGAGWGTAGALRALRWSIEDREPDERGAARSRSGCRGS